MFPLEPIAVFIGGENITSDTGEILRFGAHRRLAKELYFKRNILNPPQFEEVDWRAVYNTLHGTFPMYVQSESEMSG